MTPQASLCGNNATVVQEFRAAGRKRLQCWLRIIWNANTVQYITVSTLSNVHYGQYR
jgi:hypothetical protein